MGAEPANNNKDDYNIVLNDYGYYEVSPMPDKETLNAFYAEQYFQDDDVIYQKQYEDEERAYYIESTERKYAFLNETVNLTAESHPRVLEIGMGEGYALKVFDDKGFDVLGVDFSDFAVKQHNPDMVDKTMVADPDSAVEQFIEEGRQFDLVWLDNVLEHSPTPKTLLTNLNKIAAPGACVFIEVPNDFSLIQMELKKRNLIKSDFWVAPPMHLSYFNIDALNKLSADCGWRFLRGMSDFPVDFFLMNEKSNYNLDPSVGKSAHHARIAIERMLNEQDTSKVIAFYEAMLNVGLGREISSIYVKDE
ncbi:MAG: class I SAM-dependent methyltransferase [Pseudomonadota bacterium]